jgi:protein gp37
MTANSAIEWCDDTFAPWFGCSRIDLECRLCYAAVWTRRFKKAGWGNSPRVRSAKSTWRQPLTWQRKAAKEGLRRRVFCSELSDFFDNQAPDEWRADLWDLIRKCPDLDWQLLTKRPQNIRRMLPADWDGGWPNVWLGATAGHQKSWDRLSALRAIPAVLRFVSCEPMLGPVNANLDGISWVICGAEADKEKKGRERSCSPIGRGISCANPGRPVSPFS